MKRLLKHLQPIKAFFIRIVSNRLSEKTNDDEPMIIEIYKEHLIELYDFAYEQAKKTGKIDELKEINRKINGCK